MLSRFHGLARRKKLKEEKLKDWKKEKKTNAQGWIQCSWLVHVALLQIFITHNLYDFIALDLINFWKNPY